MQKILLLFVIVCSNVSLLSAQKLKADFSISTAYGCAPLQSVFTDKSSGQYAIVAWQWNFGDGGTSTVQSPAHTYTAKGRFPVTLIVKDASGATDTALVGDNADAAYSLPFLNLADRSVKCDTSTPVYLNANGSNAEPPAGWPLTYLWSNGETTAGITVNDYARFYKVAATGCGQTIRDSTAVFLSGGTIRILPLIYGYWDTFTGGYNATFKSYNPSLYIFLKYARWDWGDGTRSEFQFRNEDQFTHIYAKPGSYKITLTTVPDDNAKLECPDSVATMQFEVRPSYGFHSSWHNRDTTVPEGVVITLKAEIPNATSYYFYSRDGTFESLTDSVNLTKAGNYSLVTIINGDVIRDTFTLHTITPDYTLNAGIKIASNSCGIVSFNDTSTYNKYPIVKRTWNFGDGGVDTTLHPTHTYTQSGDYTVSLIAFNSINATDTTTLKVSVVNKPVAQIQDAVRYNAGDTAFVSSWVTLPDYHYLWLPSGDTTFLLQLTSPLPSVQPYVLMITYCNVTARDSGTAIAYPKVPTVKATISSEDICKDFVSLHASTNLPAGSYTLNWSNGDTGSDIDTVYNGVVYTVKARDKYTNQVLAIDTIDVALPPPYKVSFSYRNDTLLSTIDKPGNYHYFWARNDTFLSTPTTGVFVNPPSGIYKAVIFDDNSCRVATTTFKVIRPGDSTYVTINTSRNCAGPITFTGSVKTKPGDAVKSYNWLIYGNSRYTTPTVTVAAPSDSSYPYAKLTVYTVLGDTASATIPVSKASGIRFLRDSTAYTTCTGKAKLWVFPYSPDTAGYKIKWSSGQQNVTTIDVDSSGYYKASLYDNCGNLVDSRQFNISITALSTARLYISRGEKYDSIIATPSSGSYIWKWYLDDTFLPEYQYQGYIVAPKAGVYKVEISNNTGCTLKSDTMTFTRMNHTALAVDFIWYNPYSTCDGMEDLILQAEVTGLDHTDAVINYVWDFGTTKAFGRITTVHLDPGTYHAKVNIVTGQGETAVDTQTIVIPEMNPTITLKNDTLVAYPTGPLYISYKWYLDGVQLAVPENTTKLVPVKSGSYKVVVAIVRGGCYGTSPAFTYTLPLTATTVDAQVDGKITLHSSFNHSFNPDNTFTVQLSVDNSGGRTLQPGEVINLATVAGTNTSIQVNVPDSLACANNYIIRVISSSPADTATWSQQFNITNQPPQPVITQRGDSLYVSGKYNWQWYKNGAPIDGATNAYYRARANASYTVMAVNGSCTSTSGAVAVVITAVGEVTLGNNTVKAFPNPSEGVVNLQFTKPLLKPVIIRVHNMQGTTVYKQTTQHQQQSIDLSGMPKGYYFVEITGYGTQKALSIILQ